MDRKNIEQLPLVLNVNQLAAVLGIGLNNAYGLVHSGHIRSIRIGRQYKIPKDALSAFLTDERRLTSCRAWCTINYSASAWQELRRMIYATQEKMGCAANGVGSIRRKIITKNGKEYNYWEARYTEGCDPVTGKQKQRSILCKTQKEAAQKFKAATASIDAGTYTIPSRMTVGQWLDIWTADYLGNVKPRTVERIIARFVTISVPL